MTARLQLIAVGGQLKVSGPKRTLTPEVVADIRRLKPCLLPFVEEGDPWFLSIVEGEEIGPPSADAGSQLESATDDLARWFLDEGQHFLPYEPFQLTHYIRVTNPARFKERLLYQISRGPEGLHYRRGDLARELRWLKKVLVKSGPAPISGAFKRSSHQR